MKTETESRIAEALNAVVAPYRKELLVLTSGERVLLACELSQICRVIASAVERASPSARTQDKGD
jgi:hypothetical protein